MALYTSACVIVTWCAQLLHRMSHLSSHGRMRSGRAREESIWRMYLIWCTRFELAKIRILVRHGKPRKRGKNFEAWRVHLKIDTKDIVVAEGAQMSLLSLNIERGSRDNPGGARLWTIMWRGPSISNFWPKLACRSSSELLVQGLGQSHGRSRKANLWSETAQAVLDFWRTHSSTYTLTSFTRPSRRTLITQKELDSWVAPSIEYNLLTPHTVWSAHGKTTGYKIPTRVSANRQPRCSERRRCL